MCTVLKIYRAGYYKCHREKTEEDLENEQIATWICVIGIESVIRKLRKTYRHSTPETIA